MARPEPYRPGFFTKGSAAPAPAGCKEDPKLTSQPAQKTTFSP